MFKMSFSSNEVFSCWPVCNSLLTGGIKLMHIFVVFLFLGLEGTIFFGSWYGCHIFMLLMETENYGMLSPCITSSS
jgi:hypothetical protein